MKWVLGIVLYVLIGTGIGVATDAGTKRRPSLEKRVVIVVAWPSLIVAKVYATMLSAVEPECRS